MSSRSLSDIPNPSSTISFFEESMVIDFPYFWGTLGTSFFPYIATSEGRVDTSKLLPTWHHGGGNWLFGDGHVRWMTIRQTLSPRPLWMPIEYGYPWDSFHADAVLKVLDQFPRYR